MEFIKDIILGVVFMYAFFYLPILFVLYTVGFILRRFDKPFLVDLLNYITNLKM